jgi:hypothetical protein
MLKFALTLIFLPSRQQKRPTSYGKPLKGEIMFINYIIPSQLTACVR